MHKKTCCCSFNVFLACKHDTKTIKAKLSQKVHFNMFKIIYNVGMAAPGHVAEDSSADLSTQHGLCGLFLVSCSQARFTLKDQQQVVLCIPLGVVD